jgi:PKD repeat protein
MEHSFNFFMLISVKSILLLVVVFSIALVGTVAAAEDSYAVRNISQAYVIPYGYLPSGTPVTSGFSLNVIGVYPSGGEEDFFTDLVQANWSYTVVVNGVENIRPVVSGSSFAISGFELCYRPSDVVTVRIMVEGKAPVVDSPLKNFTVIKAQSLFGNETVIPGSIVTIERQTAATQPPVADFTAHPTSGTAPLTVSFTDSSSGNPNGWAWYFGDEHFTEPWTLMTARAGWSQRYYHSSVVLPDGSVLLLGGENSGGISHYHDVWRSTDNGATWILINASAGWPGRSEHSTVVLPDGSIVLMGGIHESYSYLNDVWRSVDNGTTWTLMNASPGWSRRIGHSSVALPDSSILLIGGYDGDEKNDTWRSKDNGATWDLVTTEAPWSARHGHSCIVLPDESIILTGGGGSGGWIHTNDVWRSTDAGSTWVLVNASAGWLARDGHSSAVMADGSIVLMGGEDGITAVNDTWRSTDKGVTWSEVDLTAEWSARTALSSVTMPDGSIMLIGGASIDGVKNDVWRFQPVGSTARNPSHTYTTPGTYQVALQAYNAGGYNSTRKTGYITVTNPVAKIGVYRPSAHTFYLKNGTTTAINWGISTDLPVTGDWNGDGRTDVGVYRPSAHTFYLKNGTTTAINWGISTDLPVTGDWNADGMTDVGVFRPSTHMFYLKNGTALSWTTAAINWGVSTDLPVTGDWNADGMTDVGVFRPSTHMFYLRNPDYPAIPVQVINWGLSSDLPVAGTWSDAPVLVQPQIMITFNQNLTITPGTTTFTPVGGKVIWKNDDPLKPHGLKAVDASGSDYFGGQTGIVVPFGKPYEVTFETDGSFNYTTTWEPEVPGSVTVI